MFAALDAAFFKSSGKQLEVPSETTNLESRLEFLNRFISLPFDDTSALIYAQIRARLAALGTPIGSYDLQIAAIALVNHLTVVTHNTAEFSQVK